MYNRQKCAHNSIFIVIAILLGYSICGSRLLNLITKTELNKHRLDKKEIPSDPSAYIFKDSQRNGTWCLYFYDQEAKSRHRIILKDGNGSKSVQAIERQNNLDAWYF